MAKKTIVVASANKGKIKEIKDLLPEFEVVSYKELGFNEEIEETGSTFYENALIKAKTVALALNLPALADDSGLCVDALGGAPGVMSARYSETGEDKDNNEKLLKVMDGEKNRKAKFVCCMVYYNLNGEIVTATGETYGEIMHKTEGQNGFGYDVLFYSTEINKCFGIASKEEKNAVSHRFRALEKIKEKLI